MNVNEIRPDPLNPVGPQNRPADGKDYGADVARGGVQREDKVEISDVGRELAALEGAEIPPEVDPTRLGMVRRWIQAGGPNDPAVAEIVARRLLTSGDLW